MCYTYTHLLMADSARAKTNETVNQLTKKIQIIFYVLIPYCKRGYDTGKGFLTL